MIWDLHTHLAGLAGSPAERMEKLLRFADRMGVDRVMTYMGWPMVRKPTPEQLRKQNDQVLEAIGTHPDRAFGFCYVSGLEVEASLREMDRCIRDGPMVGIKLWVARPCSDPAMMPIFERAAELRAVIFQHTWRKATGNLEGESTPSDMATLGQRMSETPMICGHTGGDWQRGIRAVRPAGNVSIGTGGFDPEVGCVEMAVRELGADRIIFGSDATGRSYASQLAKVQAARVSDEAKRLILGENLRRMVRPILREKGIDA